MARKQQVIIQETVETNEELEEYLEAHCDQLISFETTLGFLIFVLLFLSIIVRLLGIRLLHSRSLYDATWFRRISCGMEVYSEFCGPCLATSFAIRKGKLEIGEDRIAMVKACADNIDALQRFKDKSEPVFLFLADGKLTRAMFGANGIELCQMITDELDLMANEKKTGVKREKLSINDLLPEETARVEEDLKLEKEYHDNIERLRVLTLAARKKRLNERLAMRIGRLNFIMFWPHCHQAHYDLYEKWDICNIQVAAKETFQLNEHTVKEALYMSDVDPNEACLHALMNGEVLVVLFKMFETDHRNFVKLMRYTLYEEIPEPKEDMPPEKQLPPIPAYERYATISKSAREVRRERYNAKLAKLAAEEEENARLASEQARLAREAEEEEARLEKIRQEEERMARIAAGLPAEPEPVTEPEPEPVGEEMAGEEAEEKTETVVTEATDVTELAEEQKELEFVKEEEEVFHSDVEVEGEDYIPPGGLFVPGLYTPPNDLAKANGLTIFYPKQVKELAQMIETEYLPPHVLIMFTVDKRHDVMEIVKQYSSEILNMGVFIGEDPFAAVHVAYTIKQYDKMVRLKKHLDRLAIMVSRKRSLPLLQLAGLNPCYISADVDSGERECLALFPVGYGDEYEEIESVVEEEIEVIEETRAEQEPVAQPEQVNEEEEDEDAEED